MSVYSPGVVDSSEKLTRFLFSPLIVDKKGQVKPNAFAHVKTNGCSIQRESLAENQEMHAFLDGFLRKNTKAVWMGVLIADCAKIRSIVIGNEKKRALCVYDTAEQSNPAHAEICQTEHLKFEADELELRHALFEAFGNKQILPPSQYREAELMEMLPAELMARV